MIHALYCIAVWWVVVNVSIVSILCWYGYHKEIITWLQAIPGQCMMVLDRYFYWICDKMLGKGAHIKDDWKDET